jgi:hypothetical protein
MYRITIYDDMCMSALLTEAVQQIHLTLAKNYSQEIQADLTSDVLTWLQTQNISTARTLLQTQEHKQLDHWRHNNTKQDSEVDLAVYSILLACMTAACSMLLTLYCVSRLYHWHAETYKVTPTAVVTMVGQTDSLHITKPLSNATAPEKSAATNVALNT